MRRELPPKAPPQSQNLSRSRSGPLAELTRTRLSLSLGLHQIRQPTCSRKHSTQTRSMSAGMVVLRTLTEQRMRLMSSVERKPRSPKWMLARVGAVSQKQMALHLPHRMQMLSKRGSRRMQMSNLPQYLRAGQMPGDRMRTTDRRRTELLSALSLRQIRCQRAKLLKAPRLQTHLIQMPTACSHQMQMRRIQMVQLTRADQKRLSS